MRENRNEMSDSQSFQTGAGDMTPTAYGGLELDTSYPHIDIDRQNMTNVDLDEDWGWNVGVVSM